MPLGEEEIRNRTYPHAGLREDGGNVLEDIAEFREVFKNVTRIIDSAVPDGRYKSLALTALEEAQMWANKGCAQTAPVVASY